METFQAVGHFYGGMVVFSRDSILLATKPSAITAQCYKTRLYLAHSHWIQSAG
jgi:hypothetical protein